MDPQTKVPKVKFWIRLQVKSGEFEFGPYSYETLKGQLNMETKSIKKKVAYSLIIIVLAGTICISNFACADVTDIFNGFTSYPGNPVIPTSQVGGWNARIYEIGNILYEPSDIGKEYKTWYTATNNTNDDGYTNLVIGYAYSSDGISWTQRPCVLNNVPSSRTFEDPYIVKINSIYYMYAELKSPGGNQEGISRLSSSNGLTWVYEQSVLEEQGSGWESTYVASPVVWKDGTTWHMLYEGATDYYSGKIGKCESTNGLTWSNRRVVFDKGPSGAWDGVAIVSDDVYFDGSTYYFTYHGSDGSLWKHGYAYTSDFISWVRYGGNPISTETSVMFAFFGVTRNFYSYDYLDDARGIYLFNTTPLLTAVSINPVSVNKTIGATQQFTSTVTGGLLPYTYRWYYVNNTAIAGATTSTLSYKANFTGTYSIYLNVTDSLNYRVKSNTATINVYSQPTVTINPASANMTIGNTQQFTSITNGGLVPYAYQWYFSNGTSIIGATASILSYKANYTGAYSIYLNVTDNLSYKAKSNTATLNVYSQPSVTINPTSVSMTVGNTQQFNSITTGGLAPYTYQWYYANNTAIAGATSSTLNYKANFTGTYNIYLNITDSLNYKAKSNTATLNVYSQPAALITPTSSILYYGQSQTFNASTTGGVAPYNYQWYINNTAVPQATNPDWTFTPRANGNYRIHLNVTDSLGSEVKSNIASDINVYSVYLMIDPQASYSSGEQINLKVTVLNQQNPKLETSLALTITVTGPSGYSFYDFQPINVTANSVGEYSFTWNTPNIPGTYVVETGIAPSSLTAYDVKWVNLT